MPTLQWIGKEKVINHHLEVPIKVLEHQYGFNEQGKIKTETGSGNKKTEGNFDNQQKLKLIMNIYFAIVKQQIYSNIRKL